MKKLVIICVLLMTYYVCGAPTFSETGKEDLLRNWLYDYYENQYNENFNQFINHLGFKESNNNWKSINSIGCIGEWQFSRQTLKHLGYEHITPDKFRNDFSIFTKEQQIEALKVLISINEFQLTKTIHNESTFKYEDFIGHTVNDVLITRAGLIAAMHLGGFGGVKYYLMSFGKIDKTDKYGTKISDYIKEFSIHDLNKKDINKIEIQWITKKK